MKIRALLPRIWRVEADSLHDLGLAFVRAQEYSDGARYYRKIFELEDFARDWKRIHQVDTFDYLDRWNGYNLRGEIYLRWLKEVEASSALMPLEGSLRDALLSVGSLQEIEHGYLFGVCDDEGPAEKELVTRHEIAHAFFALDERYRQKANAAVKNLPRDYLVLAEACLCEKGYHPRVFIDEIQAYLATGDLEHGVLGLRTLRVPLKRMDAALCLADHFEATFARWRQSASI